MFPAGMKRFSFIMGCMVLCLAGCTDNKKSGSGDMSSSVEEMVETESEMIQERSLWEVMGEETVSWADSFSSEKVDHMLYEIRGENREEFTVDNPQQIHEFFEALNQVTISEASEGYASDVGDSFCFVMKDETMVKIDFCLSCFVQDRVLYETQNAQLLWELTSQLMD